MNTNTKKNLRDFGQSIANSYSQIFFSDNKIFAGLILLITFIDFYTGFFGLISVLLTNALAHWIGFDRYKITKGYYGFNSLLVGLGLGVYFEPSFLLLFIIMLSAVLSLFLSITLEGVIGKYALPYLSIPFVLVFWVLSLATREFNAMHLNERGVFMLNDLYIMGGHKLVEIYNYWYKLPIPASVKSYFLSLGAIFFQYNILAGIILAIGIFIYSRVAFTLSLIGFYTAFFFYKLIGAHFSEISYSYIGFNYILTAIAAGGFFIVPNRSSYLWVMLLIPLVAIITISLNRVFIIYNLPIYSLPFNIVSLMFLYVLKFRTHNRVQLNTIFIQHNSPEKNLYAFLNYKERFGNEKYFPIYLPFFGEWKITQGHNGTLTHKGDWQHAWDFEIVDEEHKSFRSKGDYCDDYYCFDKNIISPAYGTVEEVVNEIPDNIIGERNLEQNWGNTIVIKHAEFLYTKLCHLKKGSIRVKQGDYVKKGDLIARSGNSGNSPYPHLHFQVQPTPYIGSKTMEYPISNYMLKSKSGADLKTNSIPQKDNIISSLTVNSALRKAFYFIPGGKIKFQVDSHTAIEWEVKLDFYLNKYIECEKSKSKAYFKVDENMLYFTHFDGDRNSLLYFFYLAAYKISFGFYTNLQLTDSYPINMVFKQNKIFLQDFIAPFYRFLRSSFHLNYSGILDDFSDTDIVLNSTTSTFIFNKKNNEMKFSFTIDPRGIQKFDIILKNQTIHASCIKD